MSSPVQGWTIKSLNITINGEIISPEGIIKNKSLDINAEIKPDIQQANEIKPAKINIDDKSKECNTKEEHKDKTDRKAFCLKAIEWFVIGIFIMAMAAFTVLFWVFKYDIYALFALCVVCACCVIEFYINQLYPESVRKYDSTEFKYRVSILTQMCKEYNLYNKETINWLISRVDNKIATTGRNKKEKPFLENISMFASLVALIVNSYMNVFDTVFTNLQSVDDEYINYSVNEIVLLLVLFFIVAAYIMFIISAIHISQSYLNKRKIDQLRDMKENLEYILHTNKEFKNDAMASETVKQESKS